MHSLTKQVLALSNHTQHAQNFAKQIPNIINLLENKIEKTSLSSQESYQESSIKQTEHCKTNYLAKGISKSLYREKIAWLHKVHSEKISPFSLQQDYDIQYDEEDIYRSRVQIKQENDQVSKESHLEIEQQQMLEKCRILITTDLTFNINLNPLDALLILEKHSKDEVISEAIAQLLKKNSLTENNHAFIILIMRIERG